MKPACLLHDKVNLLLLPILGLLTAAGTRYPLWMGPYALWTRGVTKRIQSFHCRRSSSVCFSTNKYFIAFFFYRLIRFCWSCQGHYSIHMVYSSWLCLDLSRANRRPIVAKCDFTSPRRHLYSPLFSAKIQPFSSFHMLGWYLWNQYIFLDCTSPMENTPPPTLIFVLGDVFPIKNLSLPVHADCVLLIDEATQPCCVGNIHCMCLSNSSNWV